MNILVVKMSSLGDLFHALPAVQAIQEGLNAEIDWVVQDAYVDLVGCFRGVRRVIPFHRHAWWSHRRSFLAALREQKYDVVLDMQGLLKSELVSRLARSRKRLGASFHREGSRLFYTSVAGKRNKDRHAVEENLDMARAMGVADPIVRFLVAWPDVPADLMPALSGEGRRVALLPNSRWATKNWPVACYVETAKRLLKHGPVSFFVLGGPGDEAVCRQVAEGIGEAAVSWANRCSLPETGAVLQAMDLLLANDSGPVHMAVAAGTRTLVVFGPTDPRRTGPYGPGHEVISQTMSCRPCFSRTCHKPDIPCLAEVTPERVAERAWGML